jgi:hypothetical protein
VIQKEVRIVNGRLTGRWRKTTALLAIYPTPLVTLTPAIN